MSRALILPIGTLLQFDGNKVTDHNRDPIDVDYKPIEYRKRMVNGRLRRLLVSEKRTFKIAWTDLPRDDDQTVDGFWGALSIINFYKNIDQGFDLKLTYGDNSSGVIPVMFEAISYSLNKRSKYTDLYNININLEEI